MIPLFKVHMPKDLTKLNETLNSGYIAEGPRVKEFEEKISKWIGNSKVIALNSGTSALHLALVLSDIKPDDLIISTPITSPATNVSIVNLNARIIWADVDTNTANISSESVYRLIKKHGKKVKATIAVNWGGYPCDYDNLRNAIPSNVRLIQDSAHALGAAYKGKLVGSLNVDFTAFSFQAIKHITTGDGGLLACYDSFDFERGRRLCWLGIDRNKTGRMWNDNIIEVGYKFHMNDIAASIGIHQLDELQDILTKRRKIASEYINNIKNLEYQFSPDYEALSSYWLFTIFVKDLQGFMNHMSQNGVTSYPVHIRNDNYKAFKKFTYDADKLEGVKKISESMCCIPIGEWLNDDEISQIIEAVSKWINR